MSLSSLISFRTIVVAFAVTASIGCAHDPPATAAARAQREHEILPHFAAGCLAACDKATYVELSPKGDLCRCWAPNAFQYTFAYPDTDEKLAYSRGRWNTAVASVQRCRSEGKAWEPSDDREQIVCMDPSAPGPSVAGHSGPPTELPESVF